MRPDAALMSPGEALPLRAIMSRIVLARAKDCMRGMRGEVVALDLKLAYMTPNRR